MPTVAVRPRPNATLEARFSDAIARHKSATITWANRHTWACETELTISREQIEVVPKNVEQEILSEIVAHGGKTNYRHYYDWQRVQLSLKVQIKRLPNDEWSEASDLSSPVLDRGGIGLRNFVHAALSTPYLSGAPPLLRGMGISFYLVQIVEIAIHHYR